jgi:hypothetical protein
MMQPTRNKEKGFALLFVFLMAAIVGLYLYSQLPRVAFESERDKEQLLIDRGEQYKRAIQLYVVAVKKYPAKIEDLENTNDKRYLRQRYIDPMTGKDEWRLIHVNPAGVLIDSLVQKPPAATNANGQNASQIGNDGPLTSGTSTATSTTQTAANGTAPTDPNDVNAAVRRRPSDVVGQAYTQPVNVDPNDPKTWAPITLTPPSGPGTGQPGQPGQPTGQPPSGAVGFNGGLMGQTPGLAPGQMPGQLPTPGGFPLPGQPGFNPTQNQFKIDANGQLVPVTPTQTGTVINSQTGGTQNTPNTPFGAPAPQGGGINAPGVNAIGNTPTNGLVGGISAQNPATAAINQMLTNPNPQAGAGGLGTSAGMQTNGIAGVASNFKGPSIKIYGGRQKYQEWEFIFSLTNGQGAPGQGRNPLTPGQNGLTPGQNGQQGGNGITPIGSSIGQGNPGTTQPTGNQ